MKTLLSIIALALATVGMAQTKPRGQFKQINPYSSEEVKPIQCGPYQHAYWGAVPDCTTGSAVCGVKQGQMCVDDTHTVTEAEWQALMRRLAELEEKQNPPIPLRGAPNVDFTTPAILTYPTSLAPPKHKCSDWDGVYEENGRCMYRLGFADTADFQCTVKRTPLGELVECTWATPTSPTQPRTER